MARRAPRLAKLTRPRLRSVVLRERLFALLDEAQERPLAWISGPPGAGKTTLVASWLEARDIPGVWYQVDAGDADPATFFHYLSLAAQPFAKRGERALPPFLPEYTGDLEAFARRYLRLLFERLPERAALVFDTAQEVPADALLHRVIVDAAEEIRPGVVLIVMSHADPSPEYARLSAHQAIRTIGPALLELTLPEAEAMAMGRPVRDAGTIASLHQRSGGWLAGFSLMLDALEGEHTIEQESETRRILFDYFATQIFRRLPPPSKQLLLMSSLLPVIDPAVCEQILPGIAARRVFEDFHRGHRFVERLAGTPIRYRLHALFREFLQARLLEDISAVTVDEWRRRAAQAMEKSGDVLGAFDLYVHAKAWGDAERLLVAQAPAMLGQGRWQAFDAALTRLPGEAVERSAPLAYWQGISRLGLDPAAAERHLDRAFRLYEQVDDVIGGLAAAGAACIAIFYAAEQFERLDAWFDTMAPFLRPDRLPGMSDTDALPVFTGAIIAITRRPAHPLAGPCVAELNRLVAAPLDVNLRISAAAALMLYLCYIGDIHAARRLETTIEPLLAAPDLTPLNEAFWYAYLGYLSVVENTPARGHATLEKAETIADREGFGFVLTVAYSLRSALLRVGDEAEAWLARVEPTMKSARPYDVAHFLGNRLYRAVARGQWEASVEFGLQTVDYTRVTGSVFQRLIWEQPLAWALAELGRMDEAREHVDAVAALVEATGAECYRPLVLLTEARIADLLGDQAAYLDCLRRAFGAARLHYGAQRMLSWMPFVAAPKICADALEHGIDPSLVRTLIRDYPLEAPVPAPTHWPWPIEVRTLGSFELRVAGQPVVYTHRTPRKPLSLLKAIIALGSVNVPREWLLDALWPDEEGDAAVRSFDVALHRLRKILGDATVIRVESNAVSVDSRLMHTDVRAFLELVDAASAAARRGDRAREFDLASRAMRLFSVGFLPGDSGESWTVSLRERLRARFVELVDGVASALETEQRWAEAARWYQSGLDLDALGENFYQGLMRCHVGLGRYAEGLAVYYRMRATLEATLGVSPSARSEALHRELKASALSIR